MNAPRHEAAASSKPPYLRHIAPLARDIWDGIVAQPARAGLSFFSVAIGIVALTVLLAVLGGLRDRARAILNDFGADVIEASSANADRYLTERHLRLVRANLPDCAVTCRAEDKFETARKTQIDIVRTDERLGDVRHLHVVEGRFLDHMDVVHRERHAVISRRLAELERVGLGGRLAIRGIAFRIVGIIESAAAGESADPEQPAASAGRATMFIPWTMPEDTGEGSDISKVLDAVLIRLAPGLHMQAVMDAVARLLSAPDAQLNVQWTTADQLLEGTRRLQRTIRFSVGSVTLLCLVLGGTTLTSLMLANVRDRVREIGLRRAVGATRADIAWLFVAEACCITVAASLAGLMAAASLLAVTRGTLSVPLKLGISTFLLPVLASILLGGVFSFWPARVAARIEPAEALRNE